MTRRKLVALVSAAVLLTIMVLVLSTGLILTHTDYGRGKIRGFAVPLLQGHFPNAKIYVGKVDGSLIGGVTIDTIAIRDARGELLKLHQLVAVHGRIGAYKFQVNFGANVIGLRIGQLHFVRPG